MPPLHNSGIVSAPRDSNPAAQFLVGGEYYSPPTPKNKLDEEASPVPALFLGGHREPPLH